MGAKKILLLQYINRCICGIKILEGDQETKSKRALRQREIRTKMRGAALESVTAVCRVHLL